MSETIFMDVSEVAQVLNVSESYAYKIIRTLNKELLKQNKIVVSGKVNRKYFYERVDYGGEKENKGGDKKCQSTRMKSTTLGEL